MLKLGLDTESLHLWFQNKRMEKLMSLALTAS